MLLRTAKHYKRDAANYCPNCPNWIITNHGSTMRHRFKITAWENFVVFAHHTAFHCMNC